MPNSEISAQLRQEAHSLLHARGLLALLGGYGEPHAQGSYALDVMVSRDLDIYLVTDDLSLSRFFEVGANVASLLQPSRMQFRNELTTKSALPEGLYWGVELSGEPGWKIELWAV